MQYSIARDSIVNCRNCKNELRGDDRKLLWDGNWYCRECVSSQGEAFSQYVDEHPAAISEVIPYSPRRLLHCWLNRIAFAAAFASLFGWAYVITMLPQALGMLESVMAALLLGVFIAVFGVFVMVPCIVAERLRLPVTYEVSNGLLSIRSPLFMTEIWLKDCEWRIVKSSRWALSIEAHLMPEHGVVICARTRLGRGRRLRYLCGATPEMLNVWTHFLRLSGVASAT